MRGQRKELVGRVISDKMDKTAVVAVERTTRHRLYGKVLRRVKKYKAHDERNECRVGDRVRIIESRPLSREKRWRVVEILERTGDVA
jgi:small subunit ribosomal protein S17